MRRLIIADVKSNNNHGRSTGHYFALAQNYLDLYQKVCCVKVGGGPIFKSGFAPDNLFLLPYDNLEGENCVKNKWRVLKNCHYLFRKSCSSDIIVLQMSGAVTTFLGIILFATSKNSIYCIQYSEESLSSSIKRWIYKLAKSKIKGILCPNERIGKAYDRPYCVVTDYIYPNLEKATCTSSYSQKKYDFSVIGSIWPDKGVLEAAQKLSKTNYRVLIAGKPCDKNYEALLQDIARKSHNIEFHLGFVSTEDYSRYIIESRYCILNYQGVYADRSSGVVLDIVFKNTPVVGHRCNALQFIEDEQMGYLFDDIRTFDPNIVMNENLYAGYKNGINQFKQKQQDYKRKVIEFLDLIK